MFWRFKSCGKCGGDQTLEEDLWRCWQCGHYYYPNHVQLPEPLLTEPDDDTPRSSGRRRPRRTDSARAARNINSLIRATIISDQNWWARNRQIIAQLDKGRTVSEVAIMTQQGKRQIRVVRERLRSRPVKWCKSASSC